MFLMNPQTPKPLSSSWTLAIIRGCTFNDFFGILDSMKILVRIWSDNSVTRDFFLPLL